MIFHTHTLFPHFPSPSLLPNTLLYTFPTFSNTPIYFLPHLLLLLPTSQHTLTHTPYISHTSLHVFPLLSPHPNTVSSPSPNTPHFSTLPPHSHTSPTPFPAHLPHLSPYFNTLIQCSISCYSIIRETVFFFSAYFPKSPFA